MKYLKIYLNTKINQGTPCYVINFNNTDNQNTALTCQTQSSQASSSDYYGNRGIQVAISNSFTPYALLNTSNPPTNAQVNWLDSASYQYTGKSNVTIWLTGYLAPSVSSDYLFSITTNGFAQFYLSTDSTSSQKVKDIKFIKF